MHTQTLLHSVVELEETVYPPLGTCRRETRAVLSPSSQHCLPYADIRFLLDWFEFWPAQWRRRRERDGEGEGEKREGGMEEESKEGDGMRFGWVTKG